MEYFSLGEDLIWLMKLTSPGVFVCGMLRLDLSHLKEQKLVWVWVCHQVCRMEKSRPSHMKRNLKYSDPSLSPHHYPSRCSLREAFILWMGLLVPQLQSGTSKSIESICCSHHFVPDFKGNGHAYIKKAKGYQRSRLWLLIQLDRNYFSPVTIQVYNSSTNRCLLLGWASTKSQWPGSNWGSPYAITVVDLGNFIGRLDPNHLQEPTPCPTKYPSGRSRNNKFFHPSVRHLRGSRRVDKEKTAHSPMRLLNSSSSHLSMSNHSSRYVSVKQVIFCDIHLFLSFIRNYI